MSVLLPLVGIGALPKNKKGLACVVCFSPRARSLVTAANGESRSRTIKSRTRAATPVVSRGRGPLFRAALSASSCAFRAE